MTKEIKSNTQATTPITNSVGEPTTTRAANPLTAVAATQPPGDDGLDEIRTDLTQRFRQCEDAALGCKIEAGMVMLEARENLSSEDWSLLFRGGRMPLSQATALVLVHIVQNKTVSMPEFLPQLPRSIDALHVISRLNAQKLEASIRAGVIHAAMTAREARALVRGQRGRSVPAPGAS